MAPTMTTQDMLKANLLESEDWGDAERVATQDGLTAMRSTGPFASQAVDQDNSSLEMEATFLMRNGKEPTKDEIVEYLEKHGLQSFLTDVVMYVARHLPQDPYEFLLNHMEAMVMKYLATKGKTSLGQSFELTSLSPGLTMGLQPSNSASFTATGEQRESVVRHVIMVLQHPKVTHDSGDRLFAMFCKQGDKLSEDEFGQLLRHLEASWGLHEGDTRFMGEVLRRWRYRANASNGTRGFPVFPLSKPDFTSAYPCLLRAARDRYVPASAIHRSIFIREAAGHIEDSYTMGSKLGRGAYGEVLLVVQKLTGERRVCKRILATQRKSPAEEVCNEVDLLRSMDHPHIIRIFEYFQAEDHLDIIMEPVFGGTLTRLVQGLYYNSEEEYLNQRPEGLTEGWIATLMSQMLSALVYAHEVVGVIHKDLKSDNILLVGPAKATPDQMLMRPVHAMLADFGIAEVFSPLSRLGMSDPMGTEGLGPARTAHTQGTRGRSSRVGGTPSYMSPEMFQGSFTEKCDIWSLGVVMFQVMTGEIPYRADNLLMQANVVCCPRRHPRWEQLSSFKWNLGARWLCQQLMTKEEALRPSASEAMKSEWLIQARTSSKLETLQIEDCAALQTEHLQSHLMRMAMHCITSQLNLSQLHHLNRRFQRYDTSKDGRLSHVEMRQVLEDVGVQVDADKDLIIESIDVDHSGKVEYSEFIAGVLDLGKDAVRKQLKVAFNIFDLDGSGTISMNELRHVLMQGPNDKAVPARSANSSTSIPPGTDGLLPDGMTVKEVMSGLDKDRTGQVTYQEFEQYLLKEHERNGRRLHGDYVPDREDDTE
mmetsp:Transcript_16218/g.37334  ORF Transcript_16218/g.37334 Transcript_16218/m.37334 type:complete len:819 (-) Transcript_16218:89-2545(-)